jgi:hypothetical protein
VANPFRGELGFEADGQAYTLAFTINALVALEDETELTAETIGPALSQGATGRLRMLRTVFWAALLEHHPEVTQVEAGRIITSVGPQAAMQLVAAALQRAFPPAEEAKAGSRPRKGRRAAGTSAST